MEQTENRQRTPVGAPSSLDHYNTRAARAAHIPIDRERRRKYDLLRRSVIRQIWRCFAWGCASLVLGGWLVWLCAWWTVALGALCLLFAWWLLHDIGGTIRYVRELQEYFWDSLLIGSVVVRTEPLTVAAMTNLEAGGDQRTVYAYFDGWGRRIAKRKFDEGRRRADEEWEREWEERFEEADEPEDERIWDEFWGQPRNVFERRKDEEATERAEIRGCQLCVVGDGDWRGRYRVGDRIPCSSIYGSRDEKVGIWRSMEVLPLVWGTDNLSDLRACVEAIDESEWRMLEELAPLTEGLETDRLYRVYWEPEGAPTKFRLGLLDDGDDEDDGDDSDED